ncbi:MAG: tocopherol cyclase family protein [Clostridiales bacterium]|nr:tocopherol cyclase family protein [Clostridiales bacterium]
MKYFHGNSKVNQYFEGWYFKHQDEKTTISFIPGIQYDKNCSATAFIQVITQNETYYISYPISNFYADTKSLFIRIGKNIFSEQGIAIDIDETDVNGKALKVRGNFFYQQLMPLPYSIMGPFRLCNVPCKHEVISMRHRVMGELMINDQRICMKHGIGYIESDYGSSFPNDYFWTQYNCRKSTNPQIFLSVATIPYGWKEWIGTIAVINYNHRQYRFATYLGAKVLIIRKDLAIIQQGKYILLVHMTPKKAQDLKAPVQGTMSRIIREEIECTIRYEMYEGRNKLFDFTTNQASMEYQTNGV